MNPLKALLGLSLCATLTSAQTQLLSFDDAAPGAPPSGWSLTKTGKGSPVWRIEADASAPSKPNALKQSGEATYPLALFEASNLRDGFVELKFKPVSGREDQAGGLVWRARDPAATAQRPK